MAANCFTVTMKEFNGQPNTSTYMLNKNRCVNVDSDDSGNDAIISYQQYDQNNASAAAQLLVDDTYASILSTLGTQYSAGKKFEVGVLRKGATTYATATNMILSVNNVVWAVADNTAPGTQSYLFYNDPELGFTSYIVVATLAALITATTT